MKPTLHMIDGSNAARAADPVAGRIRDFLVGDNRGSELLAALYGHVAREAIPERLRLAAGLTPSPETLPVPVSAA